MKLTILGSGVGVPTKRRGSPGYCFEVGDQQFLMDIGSGVMRQLAHADINFFSLDGVFISHFHIDHIADLTSLLFTLTLQKFTMQSEDVKERTKPFIIYGPVGTKELMEKYSQLFGDWIAPTNFALEVRELADNDVVELNAGKVIAKHVKHTENSLGFRVESSQGGSFAYSGDAGACPALVELARDVDLALFECSCSEESFEKLDGIDHLTATLAAQNAQEAGAKKLVLTHIYPATDQFPLEERAQKYFDGDVERAEDLGVYEL